MKVDERENRKISEVSVGQCYVHFKLSSLSSKCLTKRVFSYTHTHTHTQYI